MTNRLALFVFSWVAVPAISFAGCLPVAGNRILGRDLARADARFSALPADLTVGFAPSPGASRIYPAAELERIARAHGILLPDPQEICFALTMVQLQEDDAAAAMLRALPAELKVKSQDLKIVELSKAPVPAGRARVPRRRAGARGPNHQRRTTLARLREIRRYAKGSMLGAGRTEHALHGGDRGQRSCRKHAH